LAGLINGGHDDIAQHQESSHRGHHEKDDAAQAGIEACAQGGDHLRFVA
jgi:hypothetical protein